ncbi:hypothetical protein ACJJTC_001583, partial [Scirpophaga incertulas]
LPSGSQARNKISTLKVKDSLEISHRREEVDQPKPKNMENALKKHFRGDSCSIPDPIKRDQEIKSLLGIRKKSHYSTTTVCPVKNTLNCNMCCINNVKCNPKSAFYYNDVKLVKNPSHQCNYSDHFHCQSRQKHKPTCVEITTKEPRTPTRVRLYCYNQNYILKYPDCDSSQNNKTYTKKCRDCTKDIQFEYHLDDKSVHVEEKHDVECECDIPRIVESKKFYMSVSESRHKLILLNKASQYEDPRQTSHYQQACFNQNSKEYLQLKQKTIILSRKQYVKMKKAIEIASSKKQLGKRSIFNLTAVSVGTIRKKTKYQVKSVAYAVTQTIVDDNCFNMNKSIVKRKTQSVSQRTYVLFSNQYKVSRDIKATTPGIGTSSVVTRSAVDSLAKHDTFSSINVEIESIVSELTHKSPPSLHTIFKGNMRYPAPYLGISAYSLNSDEDKFKCSNTIPRPVSKYKEKKPFLLRLMSCLVKRTATAPELRSSVYDTSPSFYSDHSVHPEKIRKKRGFFSSVRKLLKSRTANE